MARPRSEEARRKALAAVADLISERGVSSLSIEEVAARSGVAKTTIYRHWPERASLIVDTVRSTFEHVGTPDTGSLRTDLQTFFEGLWRADLSGRNARLMPCLIEAASRDAEIATLIDRLGVERSQPILLMVARAQERGELPADLDPELVVTAIVGPIVFRKLIQRRTVDPALHRRLARRGDRRPPVGPTVPFVRFLVARVTRTLTNDASQPTEPSICSSISRLHSTAYSIGSVRVIGSMKPLTTMPIACSSERPRLIR